MRPSALPLLGAAALGFAAATLCFSLWSPRAASAQLKGLPVTPQIPTIVPAGASGTTTPPQPIAIEALGPDHFVVATREPRLVTLIGREGPAQNMLVTVVTHYTVRGDRLVPVEHVRVPTGYRVVNIEE